MCMECYSNPCVAACPNNTASVQPVLFCEVCGNPLYVDDMYHNIGGLVCCSDCLIELEGFFDENDEYPVCECCGKEINFLTETVYRANTDFYCENCVESSYRRAVLSE